MEKWIALAWLVVFSVLGGCGGESPCREIPRCDGNPAYFTPSTKACVYHQAIDPYPFWSKPPEYVACDEEPKECQVRLIWACVNCAGLQLCADCGVP